ncbi:MAG: hypothetical protein H6739_22185 [Alphaproteobacteria bacterium]|nr:hypothetical protein [Alphaproteobacteria bacterium]
MSDPTALALEATHRIRSSPAVRHLPRQEQLALAQNLDRIESALGRDPYASVLETPLDFRRGLQGGQQAPQAQPAQPQQPAPRQQAQPATATLGERAAETLEAVDFPGFVAGLITGTFEAIVRSTSEQMREYAELVASLAGSVDDFSRENVTPNQVRDWFAERYPTDLRVEMPRPGTNEPAKLVPQKSAEGTSPAWLSRYGLEGETLSAELTEGTLLRAGRRGLAQERMQSLATLVLMGVNRIVVDEGQIKARLQFHARAQDRTQAEYQALSAGKKAGIAAQQTRLQQGSAAMVSTVKANVQADTQVKAELMGEVNIKFRTETFPLERFADSAAIQLINRHASWQQAAAPAPANAPSNAPASNAPAAPPPQGEPTP